MNEERLFDLLDGYTRNSLSTNEKEEVARLIESDAEIRKQYTLHKLANELVLDNRIQAVSELLVSHKTSHTRRNTYLKIGSAVLVAATAVYLIYTLFGKKTTPATSATASTIEIEKSTPILKSEATTNIVSNYPTTNKYTPTITKDINETVQNNSTTSSLTTITSTSIQSLETTQLIQPNKENQRTESSPLVDCISNPIAASIFTTASCIGKESGSIVCSSLKGGTSPYKIKALQKNKELESLSNLPKGSYEVFISDKNGCTISYPSITIQEKECSTEYHFNPFNGEELTFPELEETSSLSIYATSGALFFSQSIEANVPFQWNGYPKNGELKSGYYIFVRTLENGQTIKGGITITQ